jgi:RNA polymerase sigma-70 factor (ECF subfamily)
MENPKNTGLCKETLFSDFFKKHAKSLRNHLLYKFGNQDQAEDLTQEAFIKLWQNCSEVPIEKAKSYVYTIATNSSLNVIAHEKVKLNYKNNNSHSDRSNQSPEFILEEQQFKDKLLKAIEKINETQRVAFLMHRVDGKKYAEIAEELNISIKAVEKRIHLALLELRKEFDFFK